MIKETFDEKHQRDLEIIKKLRLLDDDFMTKVFEDKECVQLILQIILEKDDLKVLESYCQYDIKNLQGRSVRLDILAQDSTGKLYDIEIQRSNKGAGAKRARYNSSLMDANITKPGEDGENLKETYVIFITEKDALKSKLPIYHIDRIIRETGELFQDGSHIIYANSRITDQTALGRLMHDFWCTKPDDMYYKILADRVRYFKEDEEGVAHMCKELEDMRKEIAEEAAEEAVINDAIKSTRSLLKIGKLTYDEIAESISCMTNKDVKKLDLILNSVNSEEKLEEFKNNLMEQRRSVMHV